jgi:hypothetical protein
MNQCTFPVTQVIASVIPGCRRADHVSKVFGAAFPFVIEPRLFMTAETLSHNYLGGCWEMYALSNGGFYMVPETDREFVVSAPNGFEGEMSADAFGITVCLYVFSLGSFDRTKPRMAATCSEQFHLLREFAAAHPEAAAIFGATD